MIILYYYEFMQILMTIVLKTVASLLVLLLS